MMQRMTEKDKLLRRVQVADFAVRDSALYLDMYPNNKKALDYFKKYMMLKEEAVKEYTSKFGPLTYSDITSDNRWTWNDAPPPWSIEAN